MTRSALRAGLALAGLAAATALTSGVNASPASAEPECLTASNDFDRDGTVDVAVGMPGAKSAAGAVEVLLSAGGEQRVIRLEAPGTRAGDRFGAAVAEVASFRAEGEEDQCSQLVVGAPGRDVGGKNDAGAAFVYRYDTAEQEFTLVREFTQGANGVPGTAQAGARFGAAFASPFHSAGTAEVVTRLYVGAPGTDVGRATDAGAFVTFKIDDGTAVDARRVTQGMGAPGTAESGDAFGSSFAVVGAGVGAGVFAGAPGENSGAGGFVHWHENPAFENVFITQNTTGVPGAAEPGDRYGASIYFAQEGVEASEQRTILLVGAPREDIGNVRNAGSVHVFEFQDGVELGDVEGFNQGTAGVAGTPETGDRFGAALGTIAWRAPLVGVPGEDIRRVRDAGMVSEVHNDRSWHQDRHRMPGVVEAGDRFGATIGNARVPIIGGDIDRGWGDKPLIGAPGENDAAGAVIAGVSGAGLPFPMGWVQQNPQPGDRYGSAIGKTN